MSDTVRVNMTTYENAGTFRLCDLYEDGEMERGLDYFDMPQEMFNRYNRVMAEYEKLMDDMQLIFNRQTNDAAERDDSKPKKSSWLKR